MVARKASSLLSESQRQQVLEALRQAESKTSGEIVPVIASVSGRYDRAEDTLALLIALIAVAAAWILIGRTAAPGHVELVPLLLIIVVGWAAGLALTTRLRVLSLPFISAREKAAEVDGRAAECFYRFGIGRTSGATGVLLYISLFERMVSVKGDWAISAKLAQGEWDEICQIVVRGLKEGRAAEGLSEAILKCGTLLARHFPRSSNDVNELRDQIHCLD